SISCYDTGYFKYNCVKLTFGKATPGASVDKSNFLIICLNQVSPSCIGVTQCFFNTAT
ncbi:6928_t:CDS:1, partial [Rhizophagus irregularis]